MVKATYRDKSRVAGILKDSFDNNQSVNYVIPQNAKREKRIKALMNYSFDVCLAFGEVFLSDDRKACALALFPDKKRVTLKSIAWDARLIFSCIGIGNVRRALRREVLIQKARPAGPMYYLWFIGVDRRYQGRGIGSQLLEELIEHSAGLQRPVYLETSTLANLPWYKRFGFDVYGELDFGYTLYFLSRRPGVIPEHVC